MPFVSSPLHYPYTSSPHEMSPPKKRKMEQPGRVPLSFASANVGRKVTTGFLLDDSDSDDDRDADPEAHVNLPATQSVVQEENHASFKNSYEPTISTVLGSRSFQRQTHTATAPNKLDLSPPSIYRKPIEIRTCSGHSLRTCQKPRTNPINYEQLVAARSSSTAGRAQTCYYGVDIHSLIEESSYKANPSHESQSRTIALESVETHRSASQVPRKANLWTEKYRARKFTDLIGDERTHRSVLRWLKGWDSIVFPQASHPKAKPPQKYSEPASDEPIKKKILLITGPPGLGKTTLAHVCAKQAGYEVQEINASDERSREVVTGRIRDMVATENVRQANSNQNGKTKKAARPVCVVVDEVDGVVGGSGGSGDNGFVKALADLLALDQKNSAARGARDNEGASKRRRKGADFRLLRPIILICNDVYHPSLRLLRQGSLAETIYARKPPLNMAISRMQSIFEKEGLPCDTDGVRQLCEATWGVSTRKHEASTGGVCEGDLRSLLVTGEWAATKLRTDNSCGDSGARLTKRWVQDNLVADLTHGGSAARSLGRGGTKELTDRIFTCHAGMTTTGSTNRIGSDTSRETSKQQVMDRLREIITACGEDDRAMLDCFTTYPTLPFQDDTFLTKPSKAYDWLHFHDKLSSLVHSSQEWELAPYLSTPLLAFHELFASTSRHSYATAMQNVDTIKEQETEPTPFAGPRASHTAAEATKANRAALQHLQSQLTLPLTRVFRSPEVLALDLLPYILRMLSPNVKPVVVGGSTEKSVASVRRGAERDMVRRAVDAMLACGVRFERGRVDHGEAVQSGAGGWIFRMEPGLDALGVFETATKAGRLEGPAKTRYAVRQVLEQEWKREVVKREQEARVRRMNGLTMDATSDDLPPNSLESRNKTTSRSQPESVDAREKLAKSGLKRDFFGRLVVDSKSKLEPSDGSGSAENGSEDPAAKRANTGQYADHAVKEGRVWVTFHEGFSNAVKKGITLKELLDGL